MVWKCNGDGDIDVVWAVLWNACIIIRQASVLVSNHVDSIHCTASLQFAFSFKTEIQFKDCYNLQPLSTCHVVIYGTWFRFANSLMKNAAVFVVASARSHWLREMALNTHTNINSLSLSLSLVFFCLFVHPVHTLPTWCFIVSNFGFWSYKTRQ